MGAPARTSGVFTLPCVFTLSAYSRAARSHTSGVLTRRSYSPFWRTDAPLVLTLPAYSPAARTHTSGVFTRRSYSHFRRTHAPLVVLAVSVTPGVVSSRSSHTPCEGSLFSRYPSHPAWSRRGLFTRLTWARCSRGIHHARRGLVAVLSHTSGKN